MKKCYVAMITPFTREGSIDYEAVKRLIEHLIEKGCDGIVVCGTTGEAPTLSENERLDLLQLVIERVSHRCEVIFGCGSNSTCDSLRLIKLSEAMDFDAYLIVTPYYNCPSQYGIYEHFATLANETKKNIYLYNIPKRCGVGIQFKTLLQLVHDFKNIIGLKQADHDFDLVNAILKKYPDFIVLSGEDGYLLEGLQHGMQGTISVIAHLYAEEIKKLFDQFEKGDDCQSLDMYLKSITKLIFAQSNPSCIKYLLSKLKLCDNYLRLPLTPVEAKVQKQLDEAFYFDE